MGFQHYRDGRPAAAEACGQLLEIVVSVEQHRPRRNLADGAELSVLHLDNS